MPPSLNFRRELTVTPEAGRTEPRLWVRRLVIWEKPGAIIRDIAFRKGLNIIWSPDAGENGEGPIGHGSGKTTLCRLIRFCLGEDSFAPEGQRQATWTKFPEGRVGAEVLVDGALFCVLRRFESARFDVVVRDASLDSPALFDTAPTRLDPLREAIANAIVGDAAGLMPASIGAERAWPAILAWATRDQECRLAHHLDWRDPESRSNSPVAGKSKADLLTVVRAVIGAITEQELTDVDREAKVQASLSVLSQKASQLHWQFGRAKESLALKRWPNAQRPDLTDIEIEALRQDAEKAQGEALQLPLEMSVARIKEVRAQRNTARAELAALEAELLRLDVLIPEREKLLQQLRAEMPGLSASVIREQNPICPVCRVPIDKVLAESCGISTATCDLNDLRAELDRKKKEADGEEASLQALRQSRPPLQGRVDLAKQKVAKLEAAVDTIEQAQFERSTALRQAERLIDEVDRVRDLAVDSNRATGEAETVEAQLEAVRQVLARHRETASSAINRLSEVFEPVMQFMVPEVDSAGAKLDGKGLQLKVNVNSADRTSAAIDSLKNVAFDIAVMIMAIQGQARHPAFLIHDSPREADLGESIYFQIPRLIRRLEDTQPAPLFQYIMTTTTKPPSDMLDSECIVLQLKGSPPSERLLKVDL